MVCWCHTFMIAKRGTPLLCMSHHHLPLRRHSGTAGPRFPAETLLHRTSRRVDPSDLLLMQRHGRGGYLQPVSSPYQAQSPPPHHGTGGDLQGLSFTQECNLTAVLEYICAAQQEKMRRCAQQQRLRADTSQSHHHHHIRDSCSQISTSSPTMEHSMYLALKSDTPSLSAASSAATSRCSSVQARSCPATSERADRMCGLSSVASSSRASTVSTPCVSAASSLTSYPFSSKVQGYQQPTASVIHHQEHHELHSVQSIAMMSAAKNPNIKENNPHTTNKKKSSSGSGGGGDTSTVIVDEISSMQFRSGLGTAASCIMQ